jgi:molybdopterin molybdotransferase
VIELIRGQARALDPERVDLAAAFGRILREPVCAPEDQPAFDRSAFDGYAVRLDDSGPHYHVVDFLRAGDWRPRVLQRGEAVQIATGAALPCPDLRVIMKEDVQWTNETIEQIRPDQDRNIRFRGEDAREGQALAQPGLRLHPGALALLASLGHVRPMVTRQPRVLHLTTGNELVAPDQTPGPGQIRDSNAVLVRSFVERFTSEFSHRRVAEDRSAARTCLDEFVDPAPDLLLISGGASVGEHDFTRPLLEELGYTLQLAKTNIRPGRPMLFASSEHSLAFGLPGNPLSHFVCLQLFVRVALDILLGAPTAVVLRTGCLAAPFSDGDNPRETYWPARFTEGEREELVPLPWSSSGDLTPLASASALLRIPPHAPPLPAGSTVGYLRTNLFA